ncbi:hypothetical protein JCM8202v2_001474 [Rhodotorula sphaerocarpa]
MAGYLEPIDTSRKAIRARFAHGLEKFGFQGHLNAFLAEQGLTARGGYMIRFGGTPTEVHSPFVHDFVSGSPAHKHKCQVADPSSESTTWTALSFRGNDGGSWSCKARRFWPVRVVLEGPTPTGVSGPWPGQEQPDARPKMRKRRDTFQREIDLEAETRRREQVEALELLSNTDRNAASGNAPALKVKIPAEEQSEQVEASSPSSPSIYASVKQLGASVAANFGPAVQQFPTAMQKSIGELREWFAQRQLPSPFEDDVEEEEERRRREARRRRRRKEAEAAEREHRET